MTDRAAPGTEAAAVALLKEALARVSLEHGVIKTCALLDAATEDFKKERRVAGAHGYGYRR